MRWAPVSLDNNDRLGVATARDERKACQKVLVKFARRFRRLSWTGRPADRGVLGSNCNG